jgi:hypothetical protein
MAKLRFDPVTYQFYYRCPPQQEVSAKVAGFGWDPLRHRYYTEDPSIAVNFVACADSYTKLLLADVFSAGPVHKASETPSRSIAVDRRNTSGRAASLTIH